MNFTFDFENESRRDVFKKLLQGIEYVYSSAVTGDIVEFGTMSGQTAQIIALGISIFEKNLRYSEKKHGLTPRQLLLFDSFEGFPKTENSIDLGSPHVSSQVWGPGMCRGISPDQLRTVCNQYIPDDRINIFPGWFRDTLSLIKPSTKLAFIHIDCDLYESTSQVLDYLFEKKHVADGCVIFFDDWNCNHASPKFGERRAWNEVTKKYNINFSDCGEYGYCGRKFIVHHP